jgi:hypothetical protein
MMSTVSRLLFPSRERLHGSIRLALGVIANVALGVWVFPQVGHTSDPQYSPANVCMVCLGFLAPTITVLALLPVFFLGRNIPKALALGLSFFPSYVAVAGFGDAISLLLGGR